jgi:hypothetical protein
MNRVTRLSASVAIGVFASLSSGCIATVGGYGYDGNDGVGVGYYEPAGVVYGGWGGGYRVGPYRGGEHRPGPGGNHAYRSAPASHVAPSIPSQSRGGGSRPR